MLLHYQPVQEVDVPQGEAQDLILTELPVRGVCGDETPQLGERSIYILLTPTLTTVGGDPMVPPQTGTCGGRTEEKSNIETHKPNQTWKHNDD